MSTPFDRYGDGTVYRGLRSKDSTVETIDLTAHEYKTLWYAATAEIERLRTALKLIEWSNDSKFQAQAATEALKGKT